MTIRKRRQPTPANRLSPPYDPMTGKHAPLVIPGEFPFCAMMQVAAEDTHDDYVVCRGYDPRHKRFFDYDENDLATKPGIPVGKPFGSRMAGVYEVGQIFPALIPLTRIGQTPGVAATSSGHPADLDELVEILYDENSCPINWTLVDSGGAAPVHFKLKVALVASSVATAWVMPWNSDTNIYDDPEEDEITVEDISGFGFVGPIDCEGEARLTANGNYEITEMQPIASMITASVDKVGNVAASDATFNIDTVAIAFPPGAVYPAGAAPTVCNNSLRIPAENNAGVVAFYNYTTELWEGFPQAYTTECP